MPSEQVEPGADASACPVTTVASDDELPIVPEVPGAFFPVYCVLEEKTAQRRRQFLVRWACRDPVSRKRYPEEWIIASDATAEVKTEWNQWKKVHPGEKRRVVSVVARPDRKRNRRIVESSDEEEEEDETPRKRVKKLPQSLKSQLPPLDTTQSVVARNSQQTQEDKSAPQDFATPSLQSSASIYLQTASTPVNPQKISVVVGVQSEPIALKDHSTSDSGEAQESFSSQSIEGDRSANAVIPDSQSLRDSINSNSNNIPDLRKSSSKAVFLADEPTASPKAVKDSPFAKSASSDAENHPPIDKTVGNQQKSFQSRPGSQICSPSETRVKHSRPTTAASALPKSNSASFLDLGENLIQTDLHQRKELAHSPSSEQEHPPSSEQEPPPSSEQEPPPSSEQEPPLSSEQEPPPSSEEEPSPSYEQVPPPSSEQVPPPSSEQALPPSNSDEQNGTALENASKTTLHSLDTNSIPVPPRYSPPSHRDVTSPPRLQTPSQSGLTAPISEKSTPSFASRGGRYSSIWSERRERTNQEIDLKYRQIRESSSPFWATQASNLPAMPERGDASTEDVKILQEERKDPAKVRLTYKERRARRELEEKNQSIQQPPAVEQQLASAPDIAVDQGTPQETVNLEDQARASSVSPPSRQPSAVDPDVLAAASNASPSTQNPYPVDSRPTAIVRRTPSPAVRDRKSRASSPQPPQHPPLCEQDIEIIIPVPLFSMAQKHYKNEFEYNKDFIQDLVLASPQQIRSEQAYALCTVLCDFTLHQDLVGNEPFTQVSQGTFSPAQLAKWTVSVSSKFAFLAAIIATLASAGEQRVIVVLVKPGLPLKYVKDFLDGSNVNFVCPALDARSTRNSNVTIHLLSTAVTEGSQETSGIDLIIGLDETFRLTHPEVRRLRNQRRKDSAFPPPTLGLCVPHSMEHFVRSESLYPKDNAEIQRLILYACHDRERAGHMTKEIAHPETIAKQLASAINDPNLPLHLPALDLLPLTSDPPQESQQPFTDDLSSSSAQMTAQKRAAPDSPTDSDFHSDKRLRRTAAELATTATATTTDLSRSTEQSSLRVADTARNPSTHAHTTSLPSSALPRQTSDLTAQISALRAENATLQRAVNVYQPQRDLLLGENSRLKSELVRLPEVEIRLLQTQEIADMTYQDLKDARQKIKTLQSQLAGSSIPDVAELGRLRDTAREVEGLKKKIASRDNDLSYARELYRTASDAAATANTDLVAAHAELDTLRPRLEAAEANQTAELKKESNMTFARRFQQEIERLKGTLGMRDRELEKLQDKYERQAREVEELKESRGMGLSTRRAGSAQPGSRAASAQPPAAAASAAGRAGTPAQRPSGDLLRAAASHVVKNAGAGGGSKGSSRTGSRAASPGPSGRGRGKSKLGP